ncbi:MAG: hypothetical protein ABMA00_17165 [Gemmatimonas sp.]
MASSTNRLERREVVVPIDIATARTSCDGSDETTHADGNAGRFMQRAAPLRLQVLGPVTVRLAEDSSAVSRVTQPRQLALLCYLTLAHPRGLHARDSLVALLWPDHDATRGRQALRNALHGLRLALGSELVITAGDGLVGVDTSLMSCDALELEHGAWVPPSRETALAVAPFQGFHVTATRAFDTWLSTERARLIAVSERVVHATHTVRWTPTTQIHRSDAYTHYVRGHFLFLRVAHGGPVEELQQSRDYFERALEIDPTYAPAVAGLANYYAVAARRGVLQPFHETFAKTIALSHRALALDATLAVPHVHFGVEAMYLADDLPRAGREFETAIALDASYAEGYRFYGVWLGLMGRDLDALHAMQTAAQLESDIAHMQSSLAAAHFAVGNEREGEQALRATLAIDAQHAPARERLLRLLERQERFEEAVVERLRPVAIVGAEAFQDAWRADGAEGYRRERQSELRRLASRLETSLVEGAPTSVGEIFAPPVLRLVAVLAQLGEWKKAKGWQLQACARRPAMAKWFAALPELRQRA